MIYKLVGNHMTINNGTESKTIMAVRSTTNDPIDRANLDFSKGLIAAIRAGWFEVAVLEEPTP